MNGILARALVAPVLTALACLALWPLVGPAVALGALAVILFFMLVRHLRHLGRLAAWLRDPVPETVP
ncbi:MAG TPA: phosphate regulon sensor protein PhoR, partial [Thiobacillaceae bacterium]